jgi:CSLREA domain-containing protein
MKARFLVALLAATFFIPAAFAGVTYHWVFNVNSTLDEPDLKANDGLCKTAKGTCTLRAAIMEANANNGSDTIYLPAGTYTLTTWASDDNTGLSGDLDILAAVSIHGAGAGVTFIQANATPPTAQTPVGGHGRVFDISTLNYAFSVLIDNVTIRNGLAGWDQGGGGAIRSTQALSLQDCIFTQNRVATAFGGSVAVLKGGSLSVTNSQFLNSYAYSGSGAIYTQGVPVNIDGSLFDGNSAGHSHSAVSFYGTIYGPSNVTLTNSTFSNNTLDSTHPAVEFSGDSAGPVTANLTNVTISSNSGSAVYANSSDTVNLLNCTIVNNWGGGFLTYGALSFKNTIINTASGPGTKNCIYTPMLTSGGANMSTDATCYQLTKPTDKQQFFPTYKPLARNGHPFLLTHALNHGSAARDYASGCPTVDARNVARPFGFGCDVGAYELNAAARSDFDLDYKADVLWRNDNTGESLLWQMNGATIAQSTSIHPGGNFNYAIVGSGDFDGDGRNDMLWRDITNGSLLVWFMNGPVILNSSAVSLGSSLGSSVAAVADFNGDSKSDILWRDNTTGATRIWLMNGASVLANNVVDPGGNPNIVIAAVGDTDRDGQADIFVRDMSTGAITAWFIDDGKKLGTTTTTLGGNQNLDVVGGGDFWGGGEIALVMRDHVTGAVTIWSTSYGHIQQSLPQAQPIDNSWKFIGVADFDGAYGYQDILWRETATGATKIWFMGYGNFSSEAPVNAGGNTTWTIYSPGPN